MFSSRILFTLCLFFSSVMAREGLYELIDLGYMEKEDSASESINDNGIVIGRYVKSNELRLFVRDIAQDKRSSREMTLDIPKVYINNKDEVIGSHIIRVSDGYWKFSEENIFQWKNPFSYFQCFNFHNVGQAPKNYSSSHNFCRNVVWSVNEKDQYLVTNYSLLSEGFNELAEKKPKAWIYENGEYTEIKEEKLTCSMGLNNAGQILGIWATGSALTKDRLNHVVIYDRAEKSTQVLELPGNAGPEDINDQGNVIGWCHDAEEGIFKGFYFEPPSTYVFISNLHPIAINNQGIILGVGIYGKEKDMPALYKDGTLYKASELCDLVDQNGKKWDSIIYLADINESGWIAARGVVNGKKCACLLKPLAR